MKEDTFVSPLVLSASLKYEYDKLTLTNTFQFPKMVAVNDFFWR